jgi:hypothetical protein
VGIFHVSIYDGFFLWVISLWAIVMETSSGWVILGLENNSWDTQELG